MEEEYKESSEVIVRRMHPLSARRMLQFLLTELENRNKLSDEQPSDQSE